MQLQRYETQSIAGSDPHDRQNGKRSTAIASLVPKPAVINLNIKCLPKLKQHNISKADRVPLEKFASVRILIAQPLEIVGTGL